jgi:predicted nucleic acid-binding protein
MILVDTSVWADHFRHSEMRLVELLNRSLVLMHPFVTAELALGDLRPWDSTVAMLRSLPAATIASELELLTLVKHERLAGSGIGLVDAHLLAACRLSPGALLWSRNRKLVRQARSMRLSWPENATRR